MTTVDPLADARAALPENVIRESIGRVDRFLAELLDRTLLLEWALCGRLDTNELPTWDLALEDMRSLVHRSREIGAALLAEQLPGSVPRAIAMLQEAQKRERAGDRRGVFVAIHAALRELGQVGPTFPEVLAAPLAPAKPARRRRRVRR